MALYGLQKIHKDNVPLRPIVSFIGSTTYQLSNHLSYILAPMVRKTENQIEIHMSGLQKLRNYDLMMMKNWFRLCILIPVKYVLETVKERLEKDTTLIERTMITPTDIE